MMTDSGADYRGVNLPQTDGAPIPVLSPSPLQPLPLHNASYPPPFNLRTGTYGAVPPSSRPRRRRTWVTALLAVVLGLLAIVVFLFVIAGLGALGTSHGGGIGVHTNPAPNFTTMPAAPATPDLTAKQITLSVKTTQRECFGYGVGCDVSFTVQAGWPDGSVASGYAYDVTYTVHGLSDGDQIGTLTIDDDGTFTDDPSFGQTKSSSSKLSVTITSVDKHTA